MKISLMPKAKISIQVEHVLTKKGNYDSGCSRPFLQLSDIL